MPRVSDKIIHFVDIKVYFLGLSFFPSVFALCLLIITPSAVWAGAKKPENRYANEMDRTLEERLLNPDPNRKIAVSIQNPSQFTKKNLKEDFTVKKFDAKVIQNREYQNVKNIELRTAKSIIQKKISLQPSWNQERVSNLWREAVMGAEKSAENAMWFHANRMDRSETVPPYPVREAPIDGKRQKFLDAESATHRKPISVEELRQLLNKPNDRKPVP